METGRSRRTNPVRSKFRYPYSVGSLLPKVDPPTHVKSALSLGVYQETFVQPESENIHNVNFRGLTRHRDQ